MTDKDILQKLCQKYKFSDPEYVTIKSGPDHNPSFISTVTVNGETYKGHSSNTKKNSETQAAIEAFNYINMTYLHNVKNSNSHKICILIDADNLPNIDNEITIKELSNNNLNIFMFMSKANPITNKRIANEVIKIISPNTRPDSIDVCITTYAGSFLTKDLYDKYFIVTCDKFGLSLVDMIKNDNYYWNSKEARQITKICQIYDNL